MGLLVSVPIQIVPAVRRARARWDMVAHPKKREIVQAKLPYIIPFKAAKLRKFDQEIHHK